MIERRRYDRIPVHIDMQQAANANIWEKWSKDPKRWEKVRNWPREYAMAAGRHKMEGK